VFEKDVKLIPRRYIMVENLVIFVCGFSLGMLVLYIVNALLCIAGTIHISNEHDIYLSLKYDIEMLEKQNVVKLKVKKVSQEIHSL
jgi:hypothetical protein